jgi:RNA polymerase sigma-70 factor, ECF subfamily
MQSTSDEVLIGRIANGDRLAMQVLYVRHRVRVFRFVVRLVRDEATAEDLISEVFLDARSKSRRTIPAPRWRRRTRARQAGRFEGRSAVSTWMLAIARFKALSALRRRPDQECGGCLSRCQISQAKNPHHARVTAPKTRRAAKTNKRAK